MYSPEWVTQDMASLRALFGAVKKKKNAKGRERDLDADDYEDEDEDEDDDDDDDDYEEHQLLYDLYA